MLGLGTTWMGRQWPPGNQRYARPSDTDIDEQIRSALALVPRDQLLMLDTATGYGDAQQRVGDWLRGRGRRDAVARRVVVATKFGEVFNVRTGHATVDHSAEAAAGQLTRACEVLGGEGSVGVFYSHVTSQLTKEAARAVYEDKALRQFLVAAKRLGLVRMLGTSCSFPDVLRDCLDRGLLDDLDVVRSCMHACSVACCQIKKLKPGKHAGDSGRCPPISTGTPTEHALPGCPLSPCSGSSLGADVRFGVD